MKSVLTTFKTDPKIKKQAQKIAADMGFSLSSILNAYLTKLVRDKTIYFTVNEKPTEYMANSIDEARKELKNGDVSPKFNNAKDAIEWLDN